MNGTFEIQKPGEVIATVTISMKVKEWEELKEQLEQKWPSSDLSSLITDLVWQAKKTFYKSEDL
ncbi:unnamed protein product [marine sediment metagenome]|uniref:Uncharacterized protein n=1 Tax=marine sediment metagenome TaxID=412755 RepID=X0VX18_9ZZZZ